MNYIYLLLLCHSQMITQFQKNISQITKLNTQCNKDTTFKFNKNKHNSNKTKSFETILNERKLLNNGK